MGGILRFDCISTIWHQDNMQKKYLLVPSLGTGQIRPNMSENMHFRLVDIIKYLFYNVIS